VNRRFLPALLAFSLVALAPVFGTARGAAPNFIRPETFDNTVLPAPPAAGSLAALADLEAVLQVQADRTDLQVAWAKRVEKDSVFNNSEILGGWFTSKNLPFTADLFAKVGTDIHAVSDRIKVLYSRPRPPAIDARVHPCVTVPETYSYPSGHSMQAYVWGALLSEVFPERRAELMARAYRAAWGRIIGGVHFPTDDIGGRLVGEELVKELLADPALHDALARARAEAQPFMVQAKAA